MEVVTSFLELREAMATSAEKIALRLVKSDDLRCKNVACERVDESCACTLAREIGRVDPRRGVVGERIVELDLSGNGLDRLPEEIFSRCKNLERLTLRNNDLVADDVKKWVALKKLKLLEVSGNPRFSLTVDCYNRLAKRHVNVRI